MVMEAGIMISFFSILITLVLCDITDLYKEVGLFQRLTKICEEWPDANILLLKTGKLPQVSYHQHFIRFHLRASLYTML